MEDNDEIFTLYIIDTILLLPFRFFQEGQEIKQTAFVCKVNYVLYIGMWTALLNPIPSCNNAFIVQEQV